MMNFTDPRFWLEIVVLAITAINSAVLYLRKPGADAQADVKRLADMVATHQHEVDLRIQALASRIEHMPTDDELQMLRGDMKGLQEQVKSVSGLLERIERQMGLIQQALLQRG